MGKLFNALTAEEKSAITYYINSYSESGMASDLSYILRVWDKSKEYLYSKFGNQLILTKEVELKKSEKELREDMNKIIIEYNGFIGRLKDALYMYKERLYDYNSSEARKFDEVFGIFSADCLISNVYNGSPVTIVDPRDSSKIIKITDGMKTMKAISKLASALDVPGFEDFRIQHSMVLNQKTLKGNLCLSIHPLDYMTMSDNRCGWESCMSWRQAGCYRQGTVEMMNSDCVIVAYLTASEPMVINGFEWNNKKWRELYIVNDDMISSIKPYPYFNNDLSIIIVDWLKELMGADQYSYTMNYEPFEEIDLDEDWVFEIHPETQYMYNDFENGAQPVGAFNKALKGTYYIEYSGLSECMSCGSTNAYFETEGQLSCDDCYSPVYCDCCGDAMTDPDYIHEVDGCSICTYCYECRCEEDSFGKLHMENNLVNIYLASKETGKVDKLSPIQVYRYDLFDGTSIISDHFKKIHAFVNIDPWKYEEYVRSYYFAYIEDLINTDDFIDEEEYDFNINIPDVEWVNKEYIPDRDWCSSHINEDLYKKGVFISTINYSE